MSDQSATSTTPTNLWKIERRRLSLQQHPGQLKAWDSLARFVFVFAGTQGGKTSWLPWWLAREIEQTAREGELNDYIAVTATYDLFKLKFLPAIREVFEHILGTGRYWPSDRVLEIAHPKEGFLAKRSDDPMYARVILRAAAAGGGLESATAKAAILDECGQDEFTVETWEAVLRRLSLSQGRACGGTTIYNLGWTKTEIYDRWKRKEPGYEVVQFASTHNPLFPKEELERARGSMPDWRFRMFYLGQFTKPAGMIYDCFDDRPEIGHVRTVSILPAKWPRYTGIDFGAVNTATVWLAHDPDKDVYFLYRESLEGYMSTEEHTKRATERGTNENVVGYFGGSGSEVQQRADWSNEGVTVQEPPVGDVEAGIARVYQLLKQMRLFISSECTGILDEIGKYSRELDEQGEPTEKIKDKARFHRLDALRYVASGVTDGEVTYGPSIW